MTLHRDQHGLLRGDIEYNTGFPATVLPHISPILFPCSRCGTVTFHIAVEQPTGLAFKLPFAKKPLAATGKDYGIVCNDCTCTTGIRGRSVIDKLERRIVPTQICEAIDRFFETVADAPKAYTPGFAKFIVSDSSDPDDFLLTCLSVYRRED
jgi:hypothetical protein